MSLDGASFRVSTTAAQGVVSSDTRLHLVQRGSRVLGRYAGGTIQRGYLVGTVAGSTLRFRFAQREVTGHTHGGRSVCDIEVRSDGRLRLREHFTWETRPGAGTNTFDQITPESPNAT